MGLTVDPSRQHKDLILSKQLPAGEASQSFVVLSPGCSGGYPFLSVYLRFCWVQEFFCPQHGAIWPHEVAGTVAAVFGHKSVEQSWLMGNVIGAGTCFRLGGRDAWDARDACMTANVHANLMFKINTLCRESDDTASCINYRHGLMMSKHISQNVKGFH